MMIVIMTINDNGIMKMVTRVTNEGNADDKKKNQAKLVTQTRLEVQSSPHEKY